MSLSLHEAIHQFLKWMDCRRSPKTINLYKFYLERFSDQVGVIPLDQIRRIHLENFSSKRNPLQILKLFFRWCLEVGEFIPISPAAKISVPKSGHRTRLLTRLEKISLLRAARGNFRESLLFLAKTGCRPGEMFSLKWENLLGPGGYTMSIEELRNGNCFFALTDFKGRARRKKESALRIIPTGKRLGRLLARLKVKTQGCEGIIFKNSSGKAWSKSSFRSAFRRAAGRMERKYNIQSRGIVPYHFRHARATELARKGVNPVILAAYLGHAGTDLLGWYVHPQTSDLIGLVD